MFYEGRLDATGDVFDSAYARNQPALFPAGGLIPGWVEALSLMKRGERWMIHVPSELAYGEEGTPDGVIPPESDLNFEVELMDVLPVQ
ncbi:MAG: FKBP-type peptidyl-prolyl cis-trans isomerase [Hyphomonadaceae bacterium]|nr:FKBP-type peptidyl-prolyl cis-trans isomerase [Hyphomonadaceae bacterium]